MAPAALERRRERAGLASQRPPHGPQRVPEPLGPGRRWGVSPVPHQSQRQFFAGGPVAPFKRRKWQNVQSSLYRLGVSESSAPHQPQDQSSERGPVSPFFQRPLHVEQSVFGPSGPRHCWPLVRGHQLHCQGCILLCFLDQFRGLQMKAAPTAGLPAARGQRQCSHVLRRHARRRASRV